MPLLSTRPAQLNRSPPWPVRNYTAWWQRHTGVSSLSKATVHWCLARTRTPDLSIANAMPYQWRRRITWMNERRYLCAAQQADWLFRIQKVNVQNCTENWLSGSKCFQLRGFTSKHTTTISAPGCRFNWSSFPIIAIKTFPYLNAS